MSEPYIEDGRLRIPIDADPKYRWWESEGQNVWKTLEELGVAQEQRKSYLRTYYLEHTPPSEKYTAIEIQLKETSSPEITISHEVTPPPDAIPIQTAIQRIKAE